ncbi:MAG TPA: hypothetical protein VIX14_10730 [Terriglobales bacterium]
MPEQQTLSKDAKMAMISQFLGFMLDVYDMALVLVMAPILGQSVRLPERQRSLAVHRDCVHVLDYHDFAPHRLRDLWALCR